MDFEPISGMTDEANAEFELLNLEFGGSELPTDADSDRECDEDKSTGESSGEHEFYMDVSVEDEKEAKAIDQLYESVCCTLGPSKCACWTQFDRKSVISTPAKSRAIKG